ncbi:MAG: ribosome-associated translation inhibitor RaiA [Acidobacteriota bacterium]|nr:ribosome-associated translation inhibitor RaiA [Acidobacteriota bacterium]
MHIDVKGRNVPVPEALRTHVQRRLEKIANQVSELARLEIELHEERNPRVADRQVAEATLYLKGATLRAKDSSPEMLHSLNLVVDELARQVKRHRDKVRQRRGRPEAPSDGGGGEEPGTVSAEGWLLEPRPSAYLAT